MKIYIAGTFEDRERLQPFAHRLWALGHEVTSSWLQETSRSTAMSHEEFWKKLAVKDVAELAKADLLIYDSNDKKSSGKNIEFGLALGQFQSKLIYIVGKATSIFHQLADKRFDNWEQVVQELTWEAVNHAESMSEPQTERAI